MSCDDYCCNHGCNQGRACIARSTVARIKSSRPKDIELPIEMAPTAMERAAASLFTPALLVVLCAICAAIVVMFWRSL